MKIILGSSSHWRKAILENIMDETGFGQFITISPDIDEKAIRSDSAQVLTSKLAIAKFAAIAERVSEPAIIITSDQVVTCGGAIREKPENCEQARYFLKSYRTTPAVCVTAVYVKNTQTGWDGMVVDEATVHFDPKALTDEAIERIIDQGVIFSCAGGFAAGHSSFAPFLDRIYGEIESVMGLPKKLTTQLIASAKEDVVNEGSGSI